MIMLKAAAWVSAGLAFGMADGYGVAVFDG